MSEDFLTYQDSNLTQSLFNSEGFFVIFIVFFIIIGLIIIAFLLRSILHVFAKKGRAFGKTILSIQVPKEKQGKSTSNSTGEDNLTQIREQIGVAETLFSAVAGLKPENGIKAWFLGTYNHLSFEIVVKNNKINFYISAPNKVKSFVEQQIHAQYPHAEITEEPSYNIFEPDSHVVGARLILKQKPAFPLNTYKKMDSDPLTGILNPLSKILEDEGAVIQYVVRPAKRKWRRNGVKMIREIKKGEKFEKVANRHPITKIIGEISKFASTKGAEKDEMTGQTKQYQLTQMEEEMVKNMEEKISHGALEVAIRFVSSAKTEEKAKHNLENIVNSFSQYNIYQYGNSFGALIPSKPQALIHKSIYRDIIKGEAMILSTEELAGLWHLPTPQTETPHINWLGARKAPPPTDMPQTGVTLGRTRYRGVETIVKIKKGDRRRHLYAIGKSGSGKSVFIQNLAVQDIQNGDGVCVIDPHGDFAEYVLQHIPKERAEDVIYFNPADTDRPIGLNIMEATTEEQKDFVTQEMISIFYKLVTDPSMIGPMFEHNMRNVMLTLMSDEKMPGTIAEVPRMFTDDDFVKTWTAKIKDPMVLAFWEKEMAKTSDFHKSEMLGYLISKVGRFVENQMIRNIIGQSHSGFNFREIMDKKKILIVNLSKGLVGEINSNLLGMIIVSKLQMAAMERAQLPEEERNDFYLYIDEFQNFITDSIATILSEARKYRLDLTIAHQYITQMVDNKGSNTVRDAVLGNVGTIATFRIGPEDAEVLSKEFAPVFGAYDLINVEKYTAYIKLLIDNTAAKPFNMNTYPPTPGNKELAEAIKEMSRLKYGRPKEIVNAEILERTQLGVAVKNSSTDAAEPSL